jgi:hypothetical protein
VTTPPPAHTRRGGSGPGTEEEDWRYCESADFAKPGATSYRICTDCAERLPSTAARKERNRKRAGTEADDEIENLRELVEQGDSVLVCPSCEEVVDEDDLVTLRECSNCETEFAVPDGEPRNCTDCNRPFTRLVAERVCSSCETDDAIPEWRDTKELLEAKLAERDEGR